MSQDFRSAAKTGAKGRVTMADVARLAGVSASTVSLWLRAPGQVSADRGAAIARAVDRLGYVPNRMAGALASARSDTVGVIVPSLVNSFFAATVTALQARLARAGLVTLIGHTDYDQDEEAALVRTFLSYTPAALVLTGLAHRPETRRMLAAATLPVVEMWEAGDGAEDMSAGFSHARAGRMQARHLIDRGARRLAFIGARLAQDRRAAARADGAAEAAEAAGLPPPERLDLPEAGAGAAARALGARLGLGAPADGLIFSNDTLALGGLFAAQRAGLSVPGQVMLIGFGGLDPAAAAAPAISTVVPPHAGIGEAAAEMILARRAGQSPAAERRLPLRLEARESTARP